MFSVAVALHPRDASIAWNYRKGFSRLPDGGLQRWVAPADGWVRPVAATSCLLGVTE